MLRKVAVPFCALDQAPVVGPGPAPQHAAFGTLEMIIDKLVIPFIAIQPGGATPFPHCTGHIRGTTRGIPSGKNAHGGYLIQARMT
jgi:hypothetical protein